MRVEYERMKESWKLIELLNEYIEEKELWNTVKEIDDDYFVNNYNNWDWYLCEQVISKKFWFIKWLVENDKIDFSNLKISELTSWTDLFYSFSDTEVLLMLLSIQDEPISFLISILK